MILHHAEHFGCSSTCRKDTGYARHFRVCSRNVQLSVPTITIPAEIIGAKSSMGVLRLWVSPITTPAPQQKPFARPPQHEGKGAASCSSRRERSRAWDSAETELDCYANGHHPSTEISRSTYMYDADPASAKSGTLQGPLD